MSLKVDRVQLDIIINNDPSRKQMYELDNELKMLQKDIKKLSEGTTEWTAKSTRIKEIKTKMDELKRSIGIAGMTLRELTSHQKELNAVLLHMRPGTQEFNLLQSELKETSARIKELKVQAQGAGNTMEKTSGGFKKFVGTMTAAFAVYGGGRFFKSAAEDAIEAEDSVNRLAFAVQNVAGGTAADFEKLNKQASDLMGIFGDEEIRQAQTDLINYGLKSEQVFKLMPVLLNTTAQSKRELSEVSESVIRGIEGQTRGLKTLGVDFKDTGDAAKNLAIIQEQLAKFSGGAEAALNTQGGAVKNLKNYWGEFKEALGAQFFGDRTTGLIGSLTSATKWLGENAKAVFNVIKALGVLVSAIVAYKAVAAAGSAVQKVWNDLQVISTSVKSKLTRVTITQTAAMEAEAVATQGADNAQKNLNKSVKSNPWGLILAAVVAVIGAIVAFRKESNKAAEAQEKFKNELTNSIGESNSLFEQLKKTNAGTDERRAIIEQINEKYGEYTKNLDLENASLKEIESAQQGVNAELIKNITLKAKSEEIGKLAAKQAEILVALQKEGVSYEQMMNRPVGKATIVGTNAGGIGVVQNQIKMFSDEAEQWIANYQELTRQINTISSEYDNIANSISSAISAKKQLKKEEESDPLKADASKSADKEAEKSLKKLKDLEERTRQLRREMELSLMTDQAREIALIRDKYRKELQDAGINAKMIFDLKQKGYENLSEEEKMYYDRYLATVDRMEKEVLDKKEEYRIKDEERKAQYEKEKQDTLDEIYTTTLKGEDAEIMQSQKKYDKLIEQAKRYGLDYSGLLEMASAENEAIRQKYRDMELQKEKELQQRVFSAKIGTLQSTSRIIGSVMDMMGQKSEKDARFQKGLALAQIGIDTGVAVASGVRSAMQDWGTSSVWEKVAAVVAVVAEIVSATSSAYSLLDKNEIPQYADGLYPVIGQQTGKRYMSSISGSSATRVVRRPTMLVGEEKPEMIIDGNTYSRMEMNAPELIRAIYAWRSPQFAGGYYPAQSTMPQGIGFDKSTIDVMTRFTAAMEKISTDGVSVEYRKIKEMSQTEQRIENDFNG